MSSRDGSAQRANPPRRTDLGVILFIVFAIAIACVAYLCNSLLSV